MNYDPNKVYEISLNEIFDDAEFNCRGNIDPVSCLELAKNIKEKGLSQPIMLQPYDVEPGKKFRIIMGYRRFKAHQLNRASTIRSLIKEGLSDLEARVLNINENLQREDLTTSQEAMSISHFRSAGWSASEVEKQISKSYGWILDRYAFLSLPQEIQNEIDAGLIPLTKAKAIARLNSPEEQFEFARKIKEAKLLRKKRDVQPTSIKNYKKARNPEEIFAMQDHIRDTLGKNGLTTRALAWASGEISDLDFHKALQEYCIDNGIFYAVPIQLQGKKPIDADGNPAPKDYLL